MSAIDPAVISGEIERLVAKLGALNDSPGADAAQELVRLLMTLYGDGFARVLDIVRTERGGPDAVLERFAADPLLASLLVLHGLHPHSLTVRVNRALAGLGPYLPSETHASLVSAADDVVHVAVQTRAGTHQHREEVRAALERAIQEAAPEVHTIRIDLEEGLLQIMGLSAKSAAQEKAVS